MSATIFMIRGKYQRYFKDHWSYTKCLDTFKAMLDDGRRQFVCGFPYQLSVEEGLLDPEAVADEMSESDFSAVRWSMEMDALWFGSDEDAFFDFTSISKTRKIKYAILAEKLSSKLPGVSSMRIPTKQPRELRILSADIALMSSKKHKNDASAIFINQMIPTKVGRYMNNIIYTESQEGLQTEDQALIIRKLFDEYQCDYIVLDTNGIGLGIYDCLIREMVDRDSGELYPALSCVNDKTMAERCAVPGAPKVIWSIKANATFNSDCAFLLREAFRSDRIRLLNTEYDAEEYLNSLKGYSSLSPSDKIKFQMPYINTTLLVDELTNLQHETVAGGKIRIYEKSGKRKDRYSSLAYNYYVSTQLENKLRRKIASNSNSSSMFIIKPPANYKNGKAVNRAYGRY